MRKITIELTDEQAKQLQDSANRLDVTVEERASAIIAKQLKNAAQAKTHDKFPQGSIFRRMRKERNWTLKEVGARIGLSLDMVGYIETGVKRPSIDTLHKLCQLYGIEMDRIIESDGYTA